MGYITRYDLSYTAHADCEEVADKLSSISGYTFHSDLSIEGKWYSHDIICGFHSGNYKIH